MWAAFELDRLLLMSAVPPKRNSKNHRPNAIPIPDANANKYFSYREAWGRIKRARGLGYHFEAVTLEEGIIADRLISYLVGAGELKVGTPPDRYSFGRLIELWMISVPGPIPTKHFADLRVAVGPR